MASRWHTGGGHGKQHRTDDKVNERQAVSKQDLENVARSSRRRTIDRSGRCRLGGLGISDRRDERVKLVELRDVLLVLDSRCVRHAIEG